MSRDLPDDWYIEPTGESMILDQEKVAAEIGRLRAALLKAQILLADHMPPEAKFGNVEDMLRWLDDDDDEQGGDGKCSTT